MPYLKIVLLFISLARLRYCFSQQINSTSQNCTVVEPVYQWVWRPDRITGSYRWEIVCVNCTTSGQDDGTNNFHPPNRTIPINSYISDPVRDSRLIVRSSKPFNGETPVELLSKSYYTPNEIFYVRNNHPVPVVDVEDYHLCITGIGVTPTNLTLSQLKASFARKTITSVLQCAGSRRAEMDDLRPVAGTKWGGGAVGNAFWTGADFKSVLAYASFDLRNYPNLANIHVQFEGLDHDPVTLKRYGASIPVKYLLDGNFEPLLAYEMNGSPLPRDHGFPLRIILPGIVGVRSVKWLWKVTISDHESDTPYQKEKYKAFSPSILSTTVTKTNYERTLPIYDLPVTSYITSHKDGGSVQRGLGLVTGYAYSGGGRFIQRVEVSTDRGDTWIEAEIGPDLTKKWLKSWTWVLWHATMAFVPGWQEVWVKAVDDGNNQQPQEIKSVWNFEGYLTNTYHKIVLYGN
ncbi:sulfite oxidase, mitochondrial [Folsomia candida]|uniref:sulfite oxidase, mitochondrial n=1 Tax=Folsomia candida TaxID=158441 RepID=UPI000B8F5DB8|nr:sulfite oxidase, mitochondrial [Folsomia candida]